MATVLFGAGIVQMSGSIAGVVHARNRMGNYIRPRTKPVNPKSVRQQAIRTFMKFFTQRWHDTLSAAQRSAWETYAAAVPSKNRLGQIIHPTGFNRYLAINIVRALAQNSKCDDGPVTLTLPEADPTFALAAYTSTQKLSLIHDVTLPWTQIAASVMAIFMGQPQGNTINFFNGPWRYAGLINGNGTSPSLINPPFTIITGQKIWAYGRIATGPTDARLGPPMVVTCTAIAAPP
jgi:hypothetical protein